MLSVVLARQAAGLPFPNAERVGILCIAVTAAASVLNGEALVVRFINILVSISKIGFLNAAKPKMKAINKSRPPEFVPRSIHVCMKLIQTSMISIQFSHLNYHQPQLPSFYPL